MKLRSYIYSMLAGVAVFTLASCADSVSEFFGLNDDELISFTATTEEIIEEETRAAIEEDSRVTAFKDTQPKKPLLLCSSVTKRDEEATRGHRFGDDANDELTAFRVTAFLTNKNIAQENFDAMAPNFFYNVKAEKNSNDIFDIEHEYYWPASNEKLWFYAYTPCDDSNVQISEQSATGAQKVSFTVDTDVTKQIDLMTANTASTDFTSASGTTTKTSVALNFRHELTAIRFVIGEQWLAGSIKSIGIYNVHGRGTMTIGDNDATKWEWKNKAGNTVNAVDDFVLTLNKGGLSGTSGEDFLEANLYFLMIPQSFDNNNDAYVEVKYQDNSREYTVRAPLKGQSAWVRNTTVTYAISSHELTKLKIGSIAWPSSTDADAWSGPKTGFVENDAIGLYVVNPDGNTISEYYRNVRCTYDGGSWTVHHPDGHPVFKLPGYQYFFYYPYTPTPDTNYPVEGQHNSNTAATAFFSHLIDGWAPSKIQNKLDSLAAQDLQVGKGVDDANLSSTVNATMAHQMNIGKLKLGSSKATDTWIYPIDNNHSWYYHPDQRDVVASDNFSTNKPYLHSDGFYYFVFAPVESSADTGTLLKGLDALGTSTDWEWEMKSTDRSKLLTETAISADTGKNKNHYNELSIPDIVALTATGSSLTVPVSVLLNSAALTKGTDYTVSFKNANNETVSAPTVAGTYTATFTPTGIYWGDAVDRSFEVNKDGKTITFGSAAVAKTYGDAAFPMAVTNSGTGTVTYASNNTAVATVNQNSGQVTIVGAGSATITATVEDSGYDSYATKTASYTLTVSPKTVNNPTITLADGTYTYDGTQKQPTVNSVKDGNTTIPASEYTVGYSNNINAGTATVTISDKPNGNYTITGTKTFTINPKQLSGTELKFNETSVVKTYVWEIVGYINTSLVKPSGCSVTYTSNKDGVASVDGSTGVLTPGGTVGTNAAATATITATATGNYSGSTSYTIRATNKAITFSYTGGMQYITLPKGTFLLEVWGSQGGDEILGYGKGGKGGYAKGHKSFTANTPLYICVGEAGTGMAAATGSLPSTYNGGGGLVSQGYGSSGGGCTHIAMTTDRGELRNYAGHTSEVIIVAGGGGGSGCWPNAYTTTNGTSIPKNTAYNGGAGGGTTGGNGSGSSSNEPGIMTFYGGGQNGPGDGTIIYKSGTARNGNGGFGYGGLGHGGGCIGAGGGAGWYGGTGGYDNSSGGGGSSWIGGVTGGSTTAGQQSGNGQAKITWVSSI